MNRYVQALATPLAPTLGRYQDQVLSLRFFKALGRRRQNPPESFYDKVFWMSANADTTLWTRLADKVSVRDYVAERCGNGILTDLYATYDSADSIDFDALPDCFAIKTNNGCASNYLVRDKGKVDLDAIRDGLACWLQFPYGELTGQLHYARIRPMVLAEELLLDESDPGTVLLDFKFYCFGGEPRWCYIVANRRFDQKHTHDRMMYDMGWQPHPECFVAGVGLASVERPEALDEMRRIAASLSEGIPFVRVDLYQVNGKVRFGEMTFMPGMDPGFTESFQKELGGGIVLPPATRNGADGACRNAKRRCSSHRAGGVGDGHA